MSNLRWKVVSILAVLVIFGGLGVYPIVAAHFGVHRPGWLMEKQLKLGLDLKGGVHLVLRVKTTEALQLQTDQDMERLRETLSKAAINVTITSPDPTHFRVEHVPPDKDAAFRQVANENGRIELGQVLKLQAFAFQFVFQHTGHGATFQNGFAGHFGVIIWPRRPHPGLNVEMLVLQCVGKFMGHYHALLVHRDPVRNVELMGLWVV